MSEKVKLPHHLSAIHKKMKLDGLINDQKEYVGEIPLDEYLKEELPLEEYLKLVETSDSVIQNEIPKGKEEEVEPMIRLSEAKAMFASILADSQKNNAPVQQYQPQYQQAPVKDQYNIEDIPEFENWEVKDREYEFMDGKPVSASIASKHTDLIPLQYFNKAKNSIHILRYSSNQPSFFVENQSKEAGSVLLAEILFKFGRLKVPADQINLQKFLHIHPHKNKTFKEFDPKAKSRDVIAKEKLSHKATGLVFSVGEITNRAIASLEYPNYVDSWDIELLEEEVLAFAKKEPQKYINYTEDPTIKIKGVVKQALANGNLIYSNYRFLNRNREVILDVAKNQDEIDEAVKYFESGAGRTFYEFLLNSK